MLATLTEVVGTLGPASDLTHLDGWWVFLICFVGEILGWRRRRERKKKSGEKSGRWHSYNQAAKGPKSEGRALVQVRVRAPQATTGSRAATTAQHRQAQAVKAHANANGGYLGLA